MRVQGPFFIKHTSATFLKDFFTTALCSSPMFAGNFVKRRQRDVAQVFKIEGSSLGLINIANIIIIQVEEGV